MQTLGVSSAVVVLGLALSATPARSETVNCTPINAVPAVITAPGVYCFTKSLVTSMASGHAIDIQAHNVVLDMNGHRLGGLAAGLGTTAFGIHSLDRQNISIRNGTIRGFKNGVALEGGSGSQGHIIENLRADQNTWIGIAVEGSGSIVRNNQVVATGGTTANGPDSATAGIYASGAGVRVVDNDVVTVVPVGAEESFGILFSDGATDGLAIGNRITSADNGITYDGATTGTYRDNLTSNVTTPYTGGIDAGNNN